MVKKSCDVGIVVHVYNHSGLEMQATKTKCRCAPGGSSHTWSSMRIIVYGFEIQTMWIG
jgi:hypothetical protein